MMETKLFEIRDSCTLYLVTATKMISEKGIEKHIIKKAGYGLSNPSILITDIETKEASTDAYSWGGGRTMKEAHLHIKRNYDELKTGDVIDVEYLLGEKDEPLTTSYIEGFD